MPMSIGQAKKAGLVRELYEMENAPQGTWIARLDYIVWANAGGLHLYVTDASTGLEHWLFVPTYDPLKEMLREVPTGTFIEIVVGLTRNDNPKLLSCSHLFQNV